jgi:hypothetical protein
MAGAIENSTVEAAASDIGNSAVEAATVEVASDAAVTAADGASGIVEIVVNGIGGLLDGI